MVQGTLSLTSVTNIMSWALIDQNIVNQISRGPDEDQRTGFSIVA